MKPKPVDREMVSLSQPLANIVVYYAHADKSLPAVEFSSVVRTEGIRDLSDRPLAGKVELAESGHAIVTLENELIGLGEEDEGFGDELKIKLADGSIIRTVHFGAKSRHVSVSDGVSSVNSKLELVEWSWSSGNAPVAWVAQIHGLDFSRSYNLYIHGQGKQSLDSLRLEGNYNWHLVRKGAFGKRTCVAVVEGSGDRIDRDKLWHDFAALEFLFGTPLRLDLLVGINENYEAEAAYGASFGYRFRPDAAFEPPLPDVRGKCWISLAFPRVARGLVGAEPNPVVVGTCGYVDSTIGHMDGQYLFAQVALEALVSRLVTQKDPVVKDVDAWKKWVKSQHALLKEHAVDDAAFNVLAVKLRDASIPATFSLVAKALRGFGIDAPAEALKEIKGRNLVAHTLSMTDGGGYDIERDVRRVRMIRTLIAAILLRHLGYQGQLAGWDLDDQGWRTAVDWFVATEDAELEARKIYEAKDSSAGD